MVVEKPKRKIVVVEDEGLIAADLEARLKVAGYAVPGTADSASQALQLIRKTSPDLVLMDIRLKGKVDGIEIADQVRRELDIPVVYLTAYEDTGTLERAGQTQAFGYIRKPIASGGLKGTIEMALAKHRYERELREQRDWAAASFASVPHAVLVTDGRGRVTYLNSRAEELTGATKDQALGANCWELLRLYHRQSGAPVQDMLPVAMLQGDPVAIPAGVSLRIDAKHSYAVEGTVATRWRDGQVEGAVVTLSDVTSSVFDEEQVRQEQKQGALQRVTDGIVRHIRESAQTAEQAHGLDTSPADAFEITQRLSAFLEAPEVHMERVDVRQVLQSLEAAWIRTEDPLEVEFSPEPAIVQADAWQLTRTLAGILLHARNHRKDGSVITMELSQGEVEQVLHSARIRVSYTTKEDAAAIEQIFEPAWTSPAQDLHIAYQLTKGMGGLMAAHLEAGDCATVDVYLPRVMAEAAGAPTPRSHEPVVLLVDANAEVRRMLRTHFERNGVILIPVAESREAALLAALYPGEIPLAIVNLRSGDEARDWLANQLAAVRPTAEVRFFSGYSEPRRAAAGEMLDLRPERPLTKWDLLDRAKESIAAAASEGSLS